MFVLVPAWVINQKVLHYKEQVHTYRINQQREYYLVQHNDWNLK